ncbi:hydrogenase [Planctomycetaceae bacterium SCGC AG-212-F19]|nr:hydrogenase [Planctomycetaceae bacterium SCGC AG-212-F19]
MNISGIIHLVLALVLAPLLLGVINRTKAGFGGRVGPPLFQAYYDLWKLLHKGAVYSKTTTWVFRAGPIVALAAILTALLLLPFGGVAALMAFPGDLILLAYLLGLARFFTVLAALDTGSSFEGMGASREVFFSTLTEPALLLSLAAAAHLTLGAGALGVSLSGIHAALSGAAWGKAGLPLGLVCLALLVVLLVENCRIPFDDPNTHLELTMIHEVMVLDHGGPDLAFILYGAALKVWLFGALLLGLVMPTTGWPVADSIFALAGMFALAVTVGVVESTMARLRLLRVPQLLVGASALALLAFILELSGGLR